ncbi:MAG: DUF4134 family protein [Prevotellaceae bacterium]|nr:DUF4134 family protein [Prevotellaceae bacterium]
MLTVAGALVPLLGATAKVGATDYSGISGSLVSMNTWVLDFAYYVIMMIYAIAVLMGLYSATSIYIKIQTGEEGFTRSLIMLIGACIFLVAAVHIFPAFFGRLPVDIYTK